MGAHICGICNHEPCICTAPHFKGVDYSGDYIKSRERAAVREFAKRMAGQLREAASEGFIGGLGPLYGAGMSMGFETCADLIEQEAEK